MAHKSSFRSHTRRSYSHINRYRRKSQFTRRSKKKMRGGRPPTWKTQRPKSSRKNIGGKRAVYKRKLVKKHRVSKRSTNRGGTTESMTMNNIESASFSPTSSLLPTPHTNTSLPVPSSVPYTGFVPDNTSPFRAGIIKTTDQQQRAEVPPPYDSYKYREMYYINKKDLEAATTGESMNGMSKKVYALDADGSTRQNNYVFYKKKKSTSNSEYSHLSEVQSAALFQIMPTSYEVDGYMVSVRCDDTLRDKINEFKTDQIMIEPFLKLFNKPLLEKFSKKVSYVADYLVSCDMVCVDLHFANVGAQDGKTKLIDGDFTHGIDDHDKLISKKIEASFLNGDLFGIPTISTETHKWDKYLSDTHLFRTNVIILNEEHKGWITQDDEKLKSVLNAFKTHMESVTTIADKRLRSLVLTTMITRNFMGALDLSNTKTFDNASEKTRTATVTFLKAIHGDDVYDENGICNMDVYASKLLLRQHAILGQMFCGAFGAGAMFMCAYFINKDNPVFDAYDKVFHKLFGAYAKVLHKLNVLTTDREDSSEKKIITLKYLLDDTGVSKLMN